MLLYHFTLIRYLKYEGTIATEGLKPQAGQCGLQSHDVVWLTTNSETIFAIAWDRAGNLVKQKHDCRITLVIPSHDRKLVNWGKWLRRHDPDLFEHYLRNPYLGRERSHQTLQEWFVYFGAIPSSCFREMARLSWEEAAS